ncbi:hypothetical protein [Parvularcula marina]|uniref:Uncharacterized protein n=1 Tax=Parvularcula marina TaxID=2292771 RepID=A0A371RH94_9PROT|nr:hypothetical protein [Parvularcula marina]RFB04819.1 hypothetical protein DX908_05710 [Parvularcula marina]
MSDQQQDDTKFFMWYGLIEGTALILAVAWWYFGHRNFSYLVFSVVLIALIGSTYLLPKVLTRAKRNSDENSGD